MPLSVLASRRRRENDWTGAHRYHPKKVVVGDPEVVQQRLADGDKFVILACDGIWDVMTNDKAVSIVARALRDKQDAAKQLVRQAFLLGSTDNMTAIVIWLTNA